MQIKRIHRCFARAASAMLCCMLTFTACVNENLPSSQEQGQEMVNLSMDITNRSGVPGSDSEIKKVRIIAFDSHNGGLVINELIDNPATMPVKILMWSGVRDFYAITNEPSSQSVALGNVKSLQHLQAIRIPYDEVQQGTTFVTFGSLMGKEIKPLVTNQITIENKRLAVKIDLTLNGKNFTPATSVSFSNLPDKIPLFEVPYEPASGSSKTITATLTDPGTVTTGYIWTRTATVVLPSYLFTPESDESKAARITVSQSVGDISAAIGHKASLNDYTLKRNHIYSLNASVAPDELIIESMVKNWETMSQDYPAGGGSFWSGQPQDTRVGLNGTEADATATFTATLAPNGTNVSFTWYRVKQKSNTDFTLVTDELKSGINDTGNSSTLTMKANGLEDACMVYCVAHITAPDGRIDRLESNCATFMPTGDWVQPAGTYPDMQNWIIPQNAPLGSMCLLQDNRDNKVYRVKLMADGNWWMISDLAYGNASSDAEFIANCKEQNITNLIGTGLYGVSVSANLPTGGYLYNAYAALQFKGILSDVGGPDLLKVYLSSLCPDGWHLPGNENGGYNEEWVNFIDKTRIDVVSETDIARFTYNDMTAFNAYNVEPEFTNTFSFHGGYRAGKSNRADPIDFLTLGIAVGPYGGVFTELGDRNGNNMKIPIRCLRNFK